jgi:hypothetical protein
MFVETSEMHAVGSRVLVTLTLPIGVIRTTGVVRWIGRAADGSSPGCGIAFDSLPYTKRFAIEAFCKAGFSGA